VDASGSEYTTNLKKVYIKKTRTHFAALKPGALCRGEETFRGVGSIIKSIPYLRVNAANLDSRHLFLAVGKALFRTKEEIRPKATGYNTICTVLKKRGYK
jgi:hypothetical protein